MRKDDSSDSDYENPDDDAAEEDTASYVGPEDGDIYEDVTAADSAVQHPAAAVTFDDLIYECCDPPEVTSQSKMAAPGADFANMVYGRWDSVATDDKELSFKRGDIVSIVSRQYDSYGWWIGVLNGRVGLVPRDYVTPAYQLLGT